MVKACHLNQSWSYIDLLFVGPWECNSWFFLKIKCIPICWRSQIARFMGPTRGPPGSCRPQRGPMLAPWTWLSGFAETSMCLSHQVRPCPRWVTHSPTLGRTLRLPSDIWVKNVHFDWFKRYVCTGEHFQSYLDIFGMPRDVPPMFCFNVQLTRDFYWCTEFTGTKLYGSVRKGAPGTSVSDEIADVFRYHI